MITVTRLNGGAFALNPDLIERVEQTPDTVITLVDGTKYVVRESVEEIVYRVREAKASIIALSHSLDHAETNASPRALRVVPGPEREG
jgi:flagellar protein FlbD